MGRPGNIRPTRQPLPESRATTGTMTGGVAENRGRPTACFAADSRLNQKAGRTAEQLPMLSLHGRTTRAQCSVASNRCRSRSACVKNHPLPQCRMLMVFRRLALSCAQPSAGATSCAYSQPSCEPLELPLPNMPRSHRFLWWARCQGRQQTATPLCYMLVRISYTTCILHACSYTEYTSTKMRL